jgi:hypothetical protein
MPSLATGVEWPACPTLKGIEMSLEDAVSDLSRQQAEFEAGRRAEVEAYGIFYGEFSAAMRRRRQEPVSVYGETIHHGLFGSKRAFTLVSEGVWLVSADHDSRSGAWWALTPGGARHVRPTPVSRTEARWVYHVDNPSFVLTAIQHEACIRRLAELT